MFDPGTLVAALIWGSVGFAFALYGWRMKDTMPLFGGIAMMAVSYFVSSPLWMSVAEVALIVAVFWLKKRF